MITIHLHHHSSIIEWQIVHEFPNYSENDATDPLFCSVSWMLKQAFQDGFAESLSAVLVFKKMVHVLMLESALGFDNELEHFLVTEQ